MIEFPLQTVGAIAFLLRPILGLLGAIFRLPREVDGPFSAVVLQVGTLPLLFLQTGEFFSRSEDRLRNKDGHYPFQD